MSDAGPTVALPVLVLLLALLSFSGGCATIGGPAATPPALQLAPPREGHALVYLARPYHGYASEVWPEVRFNGVPVAELKNGSYTYFYALPGRYRVVAHKAQWYSAGWGERTELAVAPGRVYFLSLQLRDQGETGDTANPGADSGTSADSLRVWRELTEAQARRRLPALRYRPPLRESL